MLKFNDLRVDDHKPTLNRAAFSNHFLDEQIQSVLGLDSPSGGRVESVIREAPLPNLPRRGEGAGQRLM